MDHYASWKNQEEVGVRKYILLLEIGFFVEKLGKNSENFSFTNALYILQIS